MSVNELLIYFLNLIKFPKFDKNTKLTEKLLAALRAAINFSVFFYGEHANQERSAMRDAW